MGPKIMQTPEEQLAVARGIIKNQDSIIEEKDSEIHQLRLELSQLRPATQPAPLSRQRPSGNQNTGSLAGGQLPSFARPTTASQHRQSTPIPTSSGTSAAATNTASSFLTPRNPTRAPQPVVINGTTHIYQNGKIISSSPGYLRSTDAAINKFGGFERRREQTCGIHRSPSTDAWNQAPMAGSEETAWHVEHVQPQQPPKVIQQADVDDETEQRQIDETEQRQIEIETRLSDNAWVEERANNVCLDNDDMLHFMRKAESLTKLCLWTWLRSNRPETCRRMGLRYLSDMDLGRDSLERLLGNDMFDYRHSHSRDVDSVLYNLIELRNRVHHFSGRSSSLAYVEGALSDVQKLAVLLYDKQSATRARYLRDQLRQAAEEVANEIESGGLLTALPFADDQPWKYHHIELFREILRVSDGAEEFAREKYSPVAFAVAMDFAKRSSGMSWNCEPDMEESLAKFQRLENSGWGDEQQSGPGDEQGHVSRQAPANQLSSSSASGPQMLFSCSNSAPAQDRTRRASF